MSRRPLGTQETEERIEGKPILGPGETGPFRGGGGMWTRSDERASWECFRRGGGGGSGREDLQPFGRRCSRRPRVPANPKCTPAADGEIAAEISAAVLAVPRGAREM